MATVRKLKSKRFLAEVRKNSRLSHIWADILTL